MARFIPIYGDRIALRVYLQKEEGKRKKSKKTLYASLRHKFKGIKKTKPKANEIKQPESSDDEPTCNDNNPYIGNRNALKGSRIVHFCLKRAVNDKNMSLCEQEGEEVLEMFLCLKAPKNLT